MALLAERAGFSRPNLSSIANGDPSVSLGAYVSLLKAIQLKKDKLLIAKNDVFCQMP